MHMQESDALPPLWLSLLYEVRRQIYLKSQRKCRCADRISFNQEQFQLRPFQISFEHLNGFLDRGCGTTK